MLCFLILFLCLRIRNINGRNKSIINDMTSNSQDEPGNSKRVGKLKNEYDCWLHLGNNTLPILRCINARFGKSLGTYIEGNRMNIEIMKINMVNTFEDHLQKAKFINASESFIVIEKSNFSSQIEFNSNIKVCISDPIGPINIISTNFNNLTYNEDSSSGILIYNQKRFSFFPVILKDCTVKESGLSDQYKGKRGGFLCQLNGNDYLKIFNCSFSGCSSKERGGCLYSSSKVEIQFCTFEDCFSKDGSIIYLSQNSNSFLFSNCVIRRTKYGKSMISVNSDMQKYLEIIGLKYEENSYQSSGIFGIRSKSVNEIIFKDCTINSCLTNSNSMKTNIKISFISCIIEYYSQDKIPMLVAESTTHLENLTITGNTTFFETHEPAFSIKNCTFHDIYLSHNIFLLKLDSSDSVSVEDCCFIDIETNCPYGGAGINIYTCKNMSFCDTNFTRVGTIAGSGGIFVLESALKVFRCIGCRLIRCYASVDSCCFTLNDTPGVQRNTQALYCNNYFEECYILPENEDSNRIVSAIRFIAYSTKASIEICGCTFVNPDIIKSKSSRMCCYQIRADNFKVYNNTYINGSNSLISIRPNQEQGMESNNFFLYENETFINCTSYDNLIWTQVIFNIEFRNVYFKDMINTDGFGNGITLLSNTQLTFTNCTFINFTSNSMSAIYYPDGVKTSFSIRNCFIDTCKSREGGAFYLQGAECIIENVTFRNCISNIGACIFCGFITSLSIKNSIFENNFAEEIGGVFYFGEKIIELELSNITANNNRAGIAGAIAYYEALYRVVDVNFYEGENNFSPKGELYIVADELREIIINDMENKVISVFKASKLTINNGNGSVFADRVTTFSIKNANMTKIEATNITNFKLNGVKMNIGEISIDNANSVEFVGCEIIESPEILIRCSDLLIKSCYFKYQKSVDSVVQMKILKRNSVVFISNSTFITNSDNYVGVDHILSTAVISLIIDKECCFNKEMDKSIRLAHGSSLDVDTRVFECKVIQTETEIAPNFETPKETKLDISGLLLIILSIVILAVLVILYCFVSTKRFKDSATDQFSAEVEAEDHDRSSFILTSLFDAMIVMTNELIDLSENDVITRAFDE